MKQTAIEWLEEQMKTWGNLPIWMRDDIVKKAKDMEKEQIEDAYNDGYSDSDNENLINKQYYNETYKSE